MGQLFYTKLAKYYDRIYHDVDYKKQVKFILKLIANFNQARNNKVLDVACGTGIHADLLQKKGFEVTGVDISNEMLNEAKKKNNKIRFIKGDMKNIKIADKFGTIINFFNSILYNTNKAEMKKAFDTFYKHLDKKGLLIFDTVDKSIGIEKEKGEYTYDSKNLKIVSKPQWVFNQKDNVMTLDIEFIINDEKMHDSHLMGAFSFEELRQIAEESGFSVSILEKDFENIKEYVSDKKSAIFVCKK